MNWLGYSHFDEPNPGQNIRNFAEAHNKPVMIAEATPRVDLKTGTGEDHWSNWYAPLFEKIQANDRIKALAYINVDWDSQSMWTGQGWGDSRVQISDTIKSNWKKEMDKDPWILASDSLFEMLDYQRWQDSVVEAVSVQLPLVNKGELVFDPISMQVSESAKALLYGLRVFDISGRLVYQKNEPAYSYQVETQGAGAGNLLMIQVRTADRILTRKAVFLD